jgi:hypothetical protein
MICPPRLEGKRPTTVDSELRPLSTVHVRQTEWTDMKTPLLIQLCQVSILYLELSSHIKIAVGYVIRDIVTLLTAQETVFSNVAPCSLVDNY